MTHKLKNINVSSNGSIFFSYTTSNNIQILHFLEKDNKNYSFNIKNTNVQSASETFSNYKNRYLKNK
jgi:hypothetical protein